MTHSLTKAALFAAAASVLTACASSPQYPTQDGQAAGAGLQMPQPRYPVQQSDSLEEDGAAPSGRPSTPVESSALAPVTAAPPAGTVETAQLAPPPAAEPSYSPPPPPAYSPPAYSPPPPPPAPVTKTVVLAPGKVVDADGRPATYKVKDGQGLDAVARAMGSSRAELAKINGLKEPYALKPGQTIKGPATRTKAYVVESGDTLYQIARRFGVSAAALADENDIEVSGSLRVGQKIKLPSGYKDKGPEKKTITVTPEPPRILAGQSPYPSSGQSPVEVGSPRAPRVQPEPPRPEPTPEPQRPASPPPPPVATLPPARPVSPPPPPVVSAPTPTPRPVSPPPVATRPTPTRPSPVSPPAVSPPPPPATRPVSPPPPPATRPVSPPPPAATPSRPPAGTAPMLPTDRPPELTDSQVAELGRGVFQWPVRGNVISSYGPKGGGRRNDGVDIGAPAGTPVKAAAAGKVVYSGGEVPGFGVTVLVQHEDGWVTVYGNLQKTDVKMQQAVAAGQQIGTVGNSGGVAQTQLHFEIRYSPSPRFKAKAIDPELVLPR